MNNLEAVYLKKCIIQKMLSKMTNEST